MKPKTKLKSEKSKPKFKIRNILWGAAVVVVLFLLLPVFFDDETAAQQQSGAQGSSQQPGSLPVIVSQNPLSQYLKRLVSFYGRGGENNSFARTQGALPQAAGIYDEQQQAAMFAAQARGRMQGETFAPEVYRAKDGVIIQPDFEGYFYGDTYYKNATYPSPSLKKSIEAAITKYHAAQAALEGKSAAYVRGEDGSLTVRYMPKEDIEEQLLASKTSYSAPQQQDYAYSGGAYGGARVISKDSSSPSGNGSRGSGAGNGVGNSSAGIYGDLSIYYGAAQAGQKPAGAQPPPANPPGTPNQPGSPGHNHDYSKIAQASGDFSQDIFREPQLTGALPNFDEEKFGDAPLLLEHDLEARLRAEFGFDDGAYVIDHDKLNHINLSAGDIEAWLRLRKGGAPFRLFGLTGLEFAMLQKQSQAAQDKNRRTYTRDIDMRARPGGDNNIFFNYPRVPYSDPAKRGKEGFYEVFFERTGYGNLFKEMNIDEARREQIQTAYKELDEARQKAAQDLAALVEQNPYLKNLKPNVTYILGKADDKSDKVMVATGLSYLYSITPSLYPEWIEKKYGSAKQAYVAVPAGEVLGNVRKDGSVSVVTTKEGETALKGFGVKGVVQIEGETLSMTNPKALKENSRAINFGVGKELARISTDAQKAKIKADAEALAKKQAAQKAAEAAKKQGQAVMGPPKPGVPVFLPFRQGSNTPPPPPGKEWITPGKNARTY